MDRKKRYWITLIFFLATVLFVAFVLRSNLHRTARVVLPAASDPDSGEGTELHGGDGALRPVEVRPDTVQAAIETLKRPDAYCRTVSVERFWSSGSAVSQLHTAVSGAWTRVDYTRPSGEERHAITDGTTTYIWYDRDRSVYSGPAGAIDADAETNVPTYEEILDLPTDTITAADYRDVSGVACIYVETAPNEGGYVCRYWVSVESGLLVVAERLQNEETVYRMASLALDADLPTADDFTLPDGTVLCKP